MEKEIKYLALVMLAFFALTQFQIFVVQREQWFDSSFSLETAHKLNQGEQINFKEYDVHFPQYYYILSYWQLINPGLTEYKWAQELSVLVGLLFIFGLYHFIEVVFGASIAVRVTSVYVLVSTTLLHYSTEPRSYIFLLASVALVLAMTKVRFKSYFNSVVYALLLGMLPLYHYFGILVVPFVLLIDWTIWKKELAFKEWLKSHIITFIFIILFLTLALSYAIPQRLRSEGTWFDSPTISSFPSALFYSSFLVDSMIIENAWFITGLYYVFILLAAALIYWFIRRFERSTQNLVLLTMLITSFLPLGILTVLSFCKGGFCNLYHHRFFLVATWMFSVALIIILFKFLDSLNLDAFQRMGKAGLLIIVVLFVAFGAHSSYIEGTHHELHRVAQNTPCEPILIGHESPFSAIPYKVYDREFGCGWKSFTTTMISLRRSRTAGFDALNESEVYWNLTLPDEEFYFVLSDYSIVKQEKILDSRGMTDVYVDDGVRLVYVNAVNSNISY